MPSKNLSVKTAREYLIAHHFTPSTRSLSSSSPGLIGIELETYPYQKIGNTIHPLEDLDELFETIRRTIADPRKIDKVDVISKKFFYDNKDSIQFEPGGQTELITGPVNTLTEVSERIKSLKQHVKEAAKPLNVHFGQHGMQPWFQKSEIDLRIKNDRYQNLIRYFDRISPFGRRMMLESSSLQISLDLGKTPEQVAKRIVLANLLVPFTTALFANSPNDADKSSSFQSYRYYVWQNLDPLRSGTSYAKRFNKETTLPEIVDGYLELVLKAPVIRSGNSPEMENRPIPFGVWLQNGIDDSFPDKADLKHHISFLFPDVRIRKFLEIRSLDVTPEGWEFVPICFYCGILYDDHSLEQALEIVCAQRDSMDGLLKQCVFGLQSDQLFALSKNLFRLAIEGYGRLPNQFKLNGDPKDRFEEYFHQFTLRRKTFSDMKIDLFE